MIQAMPNIPLINSKLICNSRSCVIESSAININPPTMMSMASSSFMALKGLGATLNDLLFWPAGGLVTTLLPEFTMKPLNPKQKHFLRALAHKLKPVVIVGGGGLTDGVINEIDQSIEHHELIKVRVNASDRQSRAQLIQQINTAVGCQLVLSIGHIAIFYRPAKSPQISLPR